MNIDKDYEDILGKIEIKGCLEFYFGFKAKGIKQTEYRYNICGVYMFVEKKGDEDNILYIGCSGHIEDGKPVKQKEAWT
mgnify:CR=1 FL=1